MIVIGIDPGLSGGVALLQDGCIPIVHRMPCLPYGKTSKGNVKRALDGAALATILDVPGAIVYLERVGAMPGQGSASGFSFGMSYWGAACVASTLGLPLHLVTPQAWKAHFKLTSDKKLAIGLASRLYPGLQLNEGTAEALLLARYGREKNV